MSDNTLFAVMAICGVVVALSISGVTRALNAIAEELAAIRHQLSWGDSVHEIAGTLREVSERYELLTRAQSDPIEQERERAIGEKLWRQAEAERIGVEVEAEMEAKRERKERLKQARAAKGAKEEPA